MTAAMDHGECDHEMSPSEHRAIARRCRGLVAGINDSAAIDALLALAEEHDVKAEALEEAQMGRAGPIPKAEG